ncbi:snRNA-activating protein complex subunit 2 [Ochotona curzoniae]|uniref:snRNA-activating protein complex subunit 2 n=1 Tax=Ochotona curzoniae TaxID=130825 RepID=UPI001B34E1F8|nr:snRNA-activating protein complex subunit 2 [Ochotona curzoniae]
MKPPPRRRATPARYVEEATGPQAWSPHEKRQLLQLLQARRGRPEPDAAELARELPSRSEEDIHDFVRRLKARALREAVQRARRGDPRGPRSEAQTPAPIEVWLDLTEKITGPLEGALTTAFCQALTIATTEPTNLLHSKPPKPTQARGKPLLLSVPGPEAAGPTAGAPGCAPKVPDPAPKMTDPTPIVPDPAPKVTDPAPIVPDPAPKVTDPGPIVPDPAPKVTDPGPIVPDPVPKVTDPSPEGTDPTPKVTGPAPRAADPPLKVPDSTPGAPGPAPIVTDPAPDAPDPPPEAVGPAPEVPGPAPEAVGPAPEAPAKSPGGDFTVDFEKIYKYLASSSRGSQGPELSASESAVVLNLLMALPEELLQLPCTALAEHMAQTYEHLTAPERSPAAAEGSPEAPASPRAPAEAGPSAPRSPWHTAGICPLNPFAVPLELLGRVASPTG